MKTVSYSQYKMYETCQRQYKYHYVDKLGTYKDSIHTIFGTAIHETLQHFIQVAFDKSLKAANEIDLKRYFKDSMMRLYKTASDTQGHFSDKIEFTEFIYDGYAIVSWFKRKRAAFFSKRKTQLLGIELPLAIEVGLGVKYSGYIDLILKENDVITIYDIKTSKAGWKSYTKNDKKTTNQLLLYKKFYSDIHDIPFDKIKVQYLICKRKVDDEAEWPIPRISSYVPANGKPSVNNAYQSFMGFVNRVFDNGIRRKDIEYTPTPSKFNCMFCEFNSMCDSVFEEDSAHQEDWFI